MVHSNISWHIFEYVSNRSKSSRNKNENLRSDCYNFKKLSVLAQTIRSLSNSEHFFKRFLNDFDSCFECKSVSYTMVYIPCFVKRVS